jgi:hypothetical protein
MAPYGSSQDEFKTQTHGAPNIQSNDQELRAIFRKRKARQAQEIRDGNYKAVGGLRSFADRFEITDADLRNDGTIGDDLLTEHLIAIHSLDAMKPSRLGRIFLPTREPQP